MSIYTRNKVGAAHLLAGTNPIPAYPIPRWKLYGLRPRNRIRRLPPLGKERDESLLGHYPCRRDKVAPWMCPIDVLVDVHNREKEHIDVLDRQDSSEKEEISFPEQQVMCRLHRSQGTISIIRIAPCMTSVPEEQNFSMKRCNAS